MEQLIGREEEKRILNRMLTTGSPELVAIYGRRRVGKTYLVHTFLKDKIIFELTGIHGAPLRHQLENFSLALGVATKSPGPLAVPSNWLRAFYDLDRFLLDNQDPQRPVVLFFDEFPWINTPKSYFLRAFDHWWNTSGTRRPNLKVIICGSAASWMIEKVFHDRGGLHNRVTQKIRLLPFTLKETESYLLSNGIVLDQYQILQVYMVMGGIPFYLQHIQPGESAAQITDRLCFTRNGPLQTEFGSLYQSLFNHSEQHERIIRALAQKGKGLTRSEIIKRCHLTTGGGTTRILNELEESGFISSYFPFGKTGKENIYRLTDEYSLFYQKFIENTKTLDEGIWLKQINKPAYLSWSGFAFESICYKHTKQIKKALGIAGVLTEESVWRYQPTIKAEENHGAQIDLLLDRQDHCINICEIKFASDEFVIQKQYADELDHKVNLFRRQTGTRKTLFLTMITTYGVKKNIYYLGRVIKEVTMQDLFD